MSLKHMNECEYLVVSIWTYSAQSQTQMVLSMKRALYGLCSVHCSKQDLAKPNWRKLSD